jgi:hypothetical protein
MWTMSVIVPGRAKQRKAIASTFHEREKGGSLGESEGARYHCSIKSMEFGAICHGVRRGEQIAMAKARGALACGRKAMDHGTLLGHQPSEAGARFLSEFHKYAPLQTAFWLKDSEESEPWLYVVSHQITDDNFDVAYGEVGRIALAIQDPWFDSFRVKLIRVDDTLAKAAADLRRRYPTRTPVHLHAQRLDGVIADEVYLYPSPIPQPIR